MKRLFYLLVVVLFGCANHTQLADVYRVDLQYYEYSVGFAANDMMDQAYATCMRTSVLRSECFITLAQELMSRKVKFPSMYCDQINPEYKMDMTIMAFEQVYGYLDDDLYAEAKEKIKPSRIRRARIQTIKNECKNYTK